VRFANGVRLNVKPTAFGKNRIQVTARIGDGLIGLPPNHPAVNWLAGALLQGGTRELSVNELQNALWNVGASATTSFLDDALNISGVTGPHDFPRQMELLAALISRPGYRPEALEHAKDLMAVALKTADYTPGEVLTVNLPVLLHGGDRRWAVLPTAEELAASKPGDMAAVLDGALKSGAIEVTVVGDVTVDRALYEAGRTLGALPMRPDPAPVPASSPTVRPPAGGGPALVLRHKGRADQAIAYVEWPTTDFYANTHQARTLVLASAILQNRLIDRVRLTEGATYAPNADATSVSELLGFGYVQATVEIPPPRVAGFYRDIEAIVADLGRTPPTADEMLRARAPLLDSEAKARQDLDFWSYYLAHSQADPRELTSIQTKIGDYNSITAAEISAVCRKYLTPDRAWKLIILPAAPGGP
jgi:zinc protease